MSDRGPQFVAEFTKEIYWLLGIELAATTAYHPQGDRQMERVNQELEQFLRLFINQRQDDWGDLLPFAEFQYNNHIHSATQNVPFLLDTGRLPQMGFEPFPSRIRKRIQGTNGGRVDGGQSGLILYIKRKLYVTLINSGKYNKEKVVRYAY